MLLPLIAVLGGSVALAQSSEPPPEPAPSDDTSTPPSTDTSTETPAAPADLSDDVDRFLSDQGVATTPPPEAPANPNAFNPRLTAFGDVLYTLGVDDQGVMPGSTPWVRSFEMDIRADVDPFAKAVAILAVEQEPPELRPAPGEEAESGFEVAPEELYVDLVTLPAGLSARVGKFKQAFGVTNRAHPHDWPWPDTPLPMASVLGEEGLNDVGAQLEWRVPNPWGLGLTLDGAAVSGAPLDPDGETALPAWLGRAEVFQRWGQVELGAGASAYGLQRDRLQGADLMLRWRKDSWRSVVLLAEAFQKVTDGTAGDPGWTATLQIQPTRSLYWGLRADQSGDAWRYGTWLSAYTTEFLRVRGGVETNQDLSEELVNLQLTFVWGSHPVEPYWVNR